MDRTADDALQALADALRRPRSRLAAFACLPPEQIEALTQHIHQACERDARQVRQDLRRALPWLSGGEAS